MIKFLLILAGISEVPVPGGGFFANSFVLNKKQLIIKIITATLPIQQPSLDNHKVFLSIIYY